MSHYQSFNVSEDELKRSPRSSDHSFEYPDSIETTSNDALLSKRPRENEPEDRRPQQRHRLDAHSSMNNRFSGLACPFAKHDPLRHRPCFRFSKMDQISRLKQHLLRVHQVPIHCVRCSQTFSTEDERDVHLRSIPGCAIQPTRTRIGITETQKAQLAQRVSSKTSKEENWYMIYEILFPGCQRPETPYLDGTQFAEELFALQDSAVKVAPFRIDQLTSALHHEGKFPPVPPEYLEAFAFAAVKDVFNTVIGQYLRGGVTTTDPAQTSLVHPSDPRSFAPPSATLKRSSLAANAMPFVPGETSLKAKVSTEQSRDEAGTFDHLPPSIVEEGMKAWTALEEPSRLDMLSMVADMDSKSWDYYLNT